MEGVLRNELVAVLARWATYLAQKVGHQCTKLKVTGSSPTEVYFFLLPQKCCFIQTDQARLGVGCPIDLMTIMSESLQ